MTQVTKWTFGGLLLLPLLSGSIVMAMGRTPVEFAISLMAFPLGICGAVAVLTFRGASSAIAVWSGRLAAGLAAGIVATLFYDGYRIAVRDVLAIPFDPFRVQPVFGQILTGLPTTHPLSLVAGWGYHLWLGSQLGMFFAALRPHGGLVAGMLFASAIQIGRWLMYPSVFTAGLGDREFFANGVIGQLLWGCIIGLSLMVIDRHLTDGSKYYARP